ncbi:hypothetical protein ACLKA6_006705 [Drosophila palustris]
MDHLLLGEKITINRSDGRVHTAHVVSKQNELQAIMVSWREGFKMMGKTIPWDCVVALNPQFHDHSTPDQDDEKENNNSLSHSSEEEFFELEPHFNEIGL